MDHRLRRFAPNECRRRERDREACGPATLVGMGDGAERGCGLMELAGMRRVGEAERRAAHHAPVAGAHLGPTAPDVLARGIVVPITPGGQHAACEIPDVGRRRGEPLQVPAEHVTGIELAPRVDQAGPHVPCHGGVVGRRPRRQAHPWKLQRGKRIGHIVCPSELERRPERITEREAEDARDDAVSRGFHTEHRRRRAGIVGGHREGHEFPQRACRTRRRLHG